MEQASSQRIENPKRVRLTHRITVQIFEGLLEATADRKHKQHQNRTQQCIVEEALTQWLRRNGFLKTKNGKV